eukprot:CAMPEP_0201579264 /NCGR_PEP_ID=MMETSP0190_2-20130828/26727_1 /ASSEMBLY_ACC=CAM_ASM_000263 /TAXON_ID=37353 /ORGANISM="Rosalina sp." /LENGTH=108 /DNA_ID=CAMNT_0048013489 /DNA_START=653 /DNA_END=979 /DNA_ORIENTATION=-
MENESKEDDNDKHKLLTSSIAQLLKSYNMVSFLPYSKNDIDSVEMVLAHVDHAIQYGEDKEPLEPSKWNKDADDQQEFSYNQQKEMLETIQETEQKVNQQYTDITDID